MNEEAQDVEFIEWSAPEYTHHERGVDWFWGLGLTVVVGAVTSLFWGNALLAFILLLGGGMIFLLSFRKPREVPYRLSAKGLRAGDTFYPYSSLESFWITEASPEPKLMLVSKKKFMLHILIPLTEHSPEEIKSFLEAYLPAVEREEPWLHILAERLGF